LVQIMRAEGITKMITVPAILGFFHREWEEERRPRGFFGDRFRYFICGAAPLDEALHRDFLDAGYPVLEGYGLTEASPVVSVNPPEGNRPGSVGIPLPGTDVRLAGDGEVLVRGPHVMLGYDGDPLLTNRTLADGWLHTGDIGRIDPDGYLFVTGHKRAILTLPNGKNVFPDELARHFERSPLVQRCRVRLGGSRVRPVLTALVEPVQPAQRLLGPLEPASRVRAEIEREIAALASELAPWKRPRTVTIVGHPAPP
jgi:long-chain acyl-CoA synthetase